MLIVPLQAVPSQSVQVTLANQNCSLSVYQTNFGMFMDVYSNGSLIIAGVICQNLNRIVRSIYLGFSGDFCFVDTQGQDDPVYTGIGTRFFLAYLEPSDLPAGVG